METRKIGIAAAAGCAAVCAGGTLLPAALAGTALGGVLAGIGGEGLAAILLVVAGGAWLALRRRRPAPGDACGCVSGGESGDGPSCRLPADDRSEAAAGARTAA